MAGSILIGTFIAYGRVPEWLQGKCASCKEINFLKTGSGGTQYNFTISRRHISHGILAMQCDSVMRGDDVPCFPTCLETHEAVSGATYLNLLTGAG